MGYQIVTYGVDGALVRFLHLPNAATPGVMELAGIHVEDITYVAERHAIQGIERFAFRIADLTGKDVMLSKGY